MKDNRFGVTEIYLEKEINRLKIEIKALNGMFENTSVELAEVVISESKSKRYIIHLLKQYTETLTEINKQIEYAEMKLQGNELALFTLLRRKPHEKIKQD